MAMGAGEEEEFAIAGGVAVGFCVRVEGVAGNDYGCGV